MTRTGNHRPAASGTISPPPPRPRRAAHHPVQPDPTGPSVQVDASAFTEEDTARRSPGAAERQRRRAATAPGQPAPEVLAREAYLGHSAQIVTQHLSSAQIHALREDSMRPELDAEPPKPRPRGRR